MRVQGSIARRLSSNAYWIDTAGVVGLYIVFVTGIPLMRANWHHIQQQMQASGASLFYGVKNAYQTTVRFEKQVW